MRPIGDDNDPDAAARAVGIAPHLRALMAEYAATRLPPAFITKDDAPSDDTNEEES